MRYLATAVVALLTPLQPLAAEPFSFVVLGDTTYSIPADFELYRSLIGAVNGSDAEFSIHVGDTKGYGDCGRAFQEKQLEFFESYAKPVVYTPGNNEWAECWRDNRGNADPVEILALMRDVFFSEPSSLGADQLPLVRQADAQEGFAEFTENSRWSYGDVTFGTLHLVGSYNQQNLRREKDWREFVRREAANLAWVEATFAAARASGHRALVLAFHSNPFDEHLRHEGGPFEPVLAAILAEAESFDGQVLIAHGHFHEFIVDRPVSELDTSTPAVSRPNVTRLQTFGWPDMKAVRVTVDTEKPWVFGFEPLYADGRSVSNSPG